MSPRISVSRASNRRSCDGASSAIGRPSSSRGSTRIPGPNSTSAGAVSEIPAFARCFGELGIPPFAPRYGSNPELVVLDEKNPKGEGADNWHSDNTFMPEPPMGSILRAVLLPPQGGDTCFASMVAAYEALSPAIQRLISGLRAVHDITRPLQKGIAAGHTTASLEEMQKKWPPVESLASSDITFSS